MFVLLSIWACAGTLANQFRSSTNVSSVEKYVKDNVHVHMSARESVYRFGTWLITHDQYLHILD